MSESQRQAQLLRSSASSAARILNERATVAGCLADSNTRNALRQVVKPNSISKTLRRAGIALILAPDPITAVPGAVMLGASFATRKKEPLNAASVFNEAQNLLSEIGSLL
jgi:hypothetical protein